MHYVCCIAIPCMAQFLAVAVTDYPHGRRRLPRATSARPPSTRDTRSYVGTVKSVSRIIGDSKKNCKW